MNAPLAAPREAGEASSWQRWNDAHLQALLERVKLSLAARIAPAEADPERLGARHAACAAAEAEAAGALAATGHVPAAVAVQERCGLSSFELDVLLLCLGPEADAEIAALLARAGAAGRPTPGLAASLAGRALPSALLAFAPTARLASLRLIEIDPTSPLAASPMRLAPRVRDFLLGLDRLDAEATFLAPAHRVSLPRALSSLAARVAEALGRAELAALVGPPEAGGSAVAAEALSILGLLPMRLDATMVPADAPALDQALALAAREGALSRLGFVISMDASMPEPMRARLLERPCGRSIVVSESAAGFPPGVVTFVLPSPDLASRAALWRAAAPRLKTKETRRLAAQFALAPEAIARVVAGADDGAQPLWSRAREEAAPALASLGQRIVPRARWDDLVLPPDTLAALREVASAAQVREVVDGAWGFSHDGGRGEGIAVLLSGPSGTGKTLAAEVLANTVQLDLFRIDLSGVVSKWIGETEKNLRRVFDAAEAGGAVLFFDEADALFGKRSEVKDSHDRYANVEVGYLLQRMESYRGLSILATNLRGNLDPAFLRRMRYAIDLPYPDEASRRAIWERHVPRKAPRSGLDLDALARIDLPGGSIRTVALNGAAMAAAERSPIGTRHMQAAARRELAKLGRLTGGAPR